MKIAVVYYSHYGNTSIVAEKIADALRVYGEVDLIEIEYAERRKGLLQRALLRLMPQLVRLADVKTDLGDYAVICFGLPVWAGRPSAPVNKYLKICQNIAQKKIICFFVYALQASADKCFAFIKKALGEKGVVELVDIYVPWAKVHEEEFLNNTIQDALKKVFKPT